MAVVKTRLAVLCALAVVVSPLAFASGGSQPDRAMETVNSDGVVVDFNATALDGQPLQQAQSGADFRLQFQLSDAQGRAIAGAYPAAWVHPRFSDEQPSAELCQQKAQTFLGGSLFAKAELDLNTYYVLTLNDAASLTVVDPLFGFGGSKLLTMVPLSAPGYDWTLSRSHEQVFISLPGSNQLARLNTADWQVDYLAGKDAATPWNAPGRLAQQPDGHYLWLAVAEGIAVFQAEPLQWIKTIPLHNGQIDGSDSDNLNSTAQRLRMDDALRADIQFSPDSRYVFISHYHQGAVSVIDSRTLQAVEHLRTGEQPVVMDYSELAQALFIGHAGEGGIAVLSVDPLKRGGKAELRHIDSPPGLSELRFSPDGRWGFVLNQQTQQLSLLDPASQRLIQHGGIGPQPEQISFSNDIAYIRHGGSEILYMVTLDDPDLGREGAPIPVVDTPGGDSAFAGHAPVTPADGIIKAPGASAVLIANPGDEAVYFYKEGMAAPMGQFNNYGHAPRAVLAIDRSLREQRQPGRYETVARMASHGPHDVVFFLDNPRVLHCFTLNIAPDPNAPVNDEPRWTVNAVNPPERLRRGEEQRIRLQLQPETANPTAKLADMPVDALIAMSSGQWRQRLRLTSDAQGRIELAVQPPLPGYYQIHIAAPLPGLDDREHPVLVLAAE